MENTDFLISPPYIVPTIRTTRRSRSSPTNASERAPSALGEAVSAPQSITVIAGAKRSCSSTLDACRKSVWAKSPCQVASETTLIG